MTKKRTHNRTKRGHRAATEKPIIVANGGTMRNGQIIGGDLMERNPQPKLNSSMPRLNVGTLPAAPQRAAFSGEGIARTGAPKNIADVPLHPNAVRQTRGDLHPWLHSQPAPLQDESESPLKHSERAISVHGGMTDRQRATIDRSNDPGEILRDAAALRRRPKPAEKA
jgi:hypothetical protein